MADVGTWSWALATRGKLKRADKFRLLVGATPALAESAYWRVRRFVGKPRRDTVPNQQLTRFVKQRWAAARADGLGAAAHAECKQLSTQLLSPRQVGGPPDEWLFEHSKRTFGFAALRADQKGWADEVDWELLLVASMLHDIELNARKQPGSFPCFAARGAEKAGRMAEEHRWSPDRRRKLQDAISIHLNPGISRRRRLEAHLLQFGTGLDVAGVLFDSLGEARRAAVVNWSPRHDGFGHQVWAQWSQEATAASASACRIAWLNRPLIGTPLLGVERRMRKEPFGDAFEA